MDANILKKKTKLKGLSKFIVSRLYYDNPQSPLNKSYRNSFYCQNILINTGDKLKSQYCKNRWCPICNRNKTAELINKYAPILSECDNLYFITLTRPNVKGEDLKGEIKVLMKTFRDIINNRIIRQHIKQGVIGLRKIECTYNAESNTYHPHFHLLVSSKECGEDIIKLWLRKNPTARPQAQDIRGCDMETGTYLEIFKYFTKLLAKDKKGVYYFNAPVMDIIFNAMQGQRVYGKIGNIKALPVNVDSDIIDVPKQVLDNPTGLYIYRNPQGFIGYYGVNEIEGTTLIEIPKPTLLTELEQIE